MREPVKLEKTIATEKAWAYPTLAHHRCYRPKATSRFILSSPIGNGVHRRRVGQDQPEPLGPRHLPVRSHAREWTAVRSAPLVRLQYQDDGARHVRLRLVAQRTVLPRKRQTRVWKRDRPSETLRSQQPAMASADDWPTYRHDNGRSGRTAASVPSNLSRTWKTTIGGRLSSPGCQCAENSSSPRWMPTRYTPST